MKKLELSPQNFRYDVLYPLYSGPAQNILGPVKGQGISHLYQLQNKEILGTGLIRNEFFNNIYLKGRQ